MVLLEPPGLPSKTPCPYEFRVDKVLNGLLPLNGKKSAWRISLTEHHPTAWNAPKMIEGVNAKRALSN